MSDIRGVDPSGNPRPILVDKKGRAQTRGTLFITPQTLIPGIAAANVLDAGDAIGTLFTLDVPERGVILSAKLYDPDDDTLALTLHIFSQSFTATASDSALAISAVDARNWLTSITFNTPTDLGSGKVHEEAGVFSPYYAPSGKLYCQASTAGVPNIAADAMPSVRLYILPLMEG